MKICQEENDFVVCYFLVVACLTGLIDRICGFSSIAWIRGMIKRRTKCSGST